MAEEESKTLPISLSGHTDLTPATEPNIHEIQMEIVKTIVERLKDPTAINLQYPGENGYLVSKHGADPDYQHGTQRRFLVLDESPLLGTDQLCIAVTENRSSTNNQTQGALLLQEGKGLHSSREITLTRFVQTPAEKVRNRNRGTYYLLVLSDLPHWTTTLSTKGRANPNRDYPPFAGKIGIPPFAEHWRQGHAQLRDAFFYDTSGKNSECQENDFRDILAVIKKAKVHSGETEKVARNEEQRGLAIRTVKT